MWLQVEARGLKPNTKFFYQWRYRQNDRKAPVRTHLGGMMSGVMESIHWRVC